MPALTHSSDRIWPNRPCVRWRPRQAYNSVLLMHAFLRCCHCFGLGEPELPEDAPERQPRWVPSCMDVPSGMLSEIYMVSGHPVLCDMVTDGGGWTLVYSGRAPPTDFGGTWHEDLSTLHPSRQEILPLWWTTSVSNSVSDFRVSCAVEQCNSSTECAFAVDLVFYDTFWYSFIGSSKSEAETCFGLSFFTEHMARLSPRRCNLLSGECLSQGVYWSSGAFESEKACDAPEDFAFDFNDRGLDSDEADGTDWGLDDGKWKCGTQACAANGTCSWFVWARKSAHNTDVFDHLFSVVIFGWPTSLKYSFYVLGIFLAAAFPVIACHYAKAIFRLADRVTAVQVTDHPHMSSRNPWHNEDPRMDYPPDEERRAVSAAAAAASRAVRSKNGPRKNSRLRDGSCNLACCVSVGAGASADTAVASEGEGAAAVCATGAETGNGTCVCQSSSHYGLGGATQNQRSVLELA